jgi:hypothetical protein
MKSLKYLDIKILMLGVAKPLIAVERSELIRLVKKLGVHAEKTKIQGSEPIKILTSRG